MFVGDMTMVARYVFDDADDSAQSMMYEGRMQILWARLLQPSDAGVAPDFWNIQLCSAQCSAAHSALQYTVLCSVAVQFSVAHNALQWLKCPIANSKYILGISWDAGVAPHFW